VDEEVREELIPSACARTEPQKGQRHLALPFLFRATISGNCCIADSLHVTIFAAAQYRTYTPIFAGHRGRPLQLRSIDEESEYW
jgi:hypothetical protein